MDDTELASNPPAPLENPSGLENGLSPPVSPTVGKRIDPLLTKVQIGQYTVQRKLGQGGMGSVWLARDEVLGRDVAIKVIAIGDADPSTARRFLLEARAAAKLNHPNVVTVYHVLDEAGELRI